MKTIITYAMVLLTAISYAQEKYQDGMNKAFELWREAPQKARIMIVQKCDSWICFADPKRSALKIEKALNRKIQTKAIQREFL